MSDIIIELRRDLAAVSEYAETAVAAIDREDDDALLSALGEMDSAMSDIRNRISARVRG